MFRSIKNLKIYAFVFAVIAVLGIALRCASLLTCFDSDIGYYKTEASLPDIFHLISVLVVPAAFSLILFLPSKETFEYAVPSSENLSVKVGSVFAICGCASYVLYILMSISGERYLSFGPLVQSKGVETVSVLAVFFGVLAVVYFALVLANKTSKGDAHVLFGYAIIIFVLMVMARTYFDFYTAMNSPNKLFTQIMLMSVMMYFLYEMRFSLGNAAPRRYVAISLVAFYYTVVSSISGIVGFFFGELSKTQYLFCDLLALAFAVYIGARLAVYISAQKDN